MSEGTDLQALIADLERAEGPDRRLDLRIGRAITSVMDFDPAAEVSNRAVRVYRYTESVDDALTLVPEGWALAKLGLAWALGWDSEPGHKSVAVLGGPIEGAAGVANSYPLALCIASLKARLP